MLRSNQIAVMGGDRSAYRAQLLNYHHDQTSHDNEALYFILFHKLHVMVRHCSTNKIMFYS